MHIIDYYNLLVSEIMYIDLFNNLVFCINDYLRYFALQLNITIINYMLHIIDDILQFISTWDY